MNTAHIRAPRAVLAATGSAAIVALSLCAISLDSAHASSSSGSSATGVSASGIDSGSANSGSLSGKSGAFSASGIRTETRPGYAMASVGSIVLGGKSLGSVTATCSQGVTHVTHSGSASSSSTVHVSYGAGGGSSVTGLVASISDTKGRGAQTIRAASVSCGKSSTSPTNPPTKTTKTPKTTSPDKGPVTGPHHHRGDTTSPWDTRPERNAPNPTPEPGHHPVTG